METWNNSKCDLGGRNANTSLQGSYFANSLHYFEARKYERTWEVETDEARATVKERVKLYYDKMRLEEARIRQNKRLITLRPVSLEDSRLVGLGPKLVEEEKAGN
jgi:hypothetical protein